MRLTSQLVETRKSKSGLQAAAQGRGATGFVSRIRRYRKPSPNPAVDFPVVAGDSDVQTCERRKHYEATEDLISESREAAACFSGNPACHSPVVGEAARQLRSSNEDLHERIALRAYELYAQWGWREDHALDDWLDAEREILGLHLL
ncbi:MAG: DUF2934 domain-containing protein [Nitrospira sp. CG24E]|nr:MAG: DUF2934 domain-containing protein [Nitrospira sp. CG24E]